MDTSHTDAFVAQLRQHLRQDATEPLQRADLLRVLARTVYDAAKFDPRNDAGVDGRDTPERSRLGAIVDDAQHHWVCMWREQRTGGADGLDEPQT